MNAGPRNGQSARSPWLRPSIEARAESWVRVAGPASVPAGVVSGALTLRLRSLGVYHHPDPYQPRTARRSLPRRRLIGRLVCIGYVVIAEPAALTPPRRAGPR